jgi:hypothetical protein
MIEYLATSKSIFIEEACSKFHCAGKWLNKNSEIKANDLILIISEVIFKLFKGVVAQPERCEKAYRREH